MFDQLRGAFASKQAMIKYLEAPPPDGEEFAEDGATHQRWTNVDLAVSPPKDRKWTQWTYLAFWTAHAAGAGNWTAGSSIIALGLPPLDAFLALAFAHVFITILIVLNGRGPARYHVGFPVFARATYGMWGSYMAISMRAVVCIIWNGTNAYYASRCVTVALTAIWPQFGTMKNTFPASAGITTNNFISFVLFMIVFVAISCVHSRDLKWFYTIKSIVVFAVMHAILGWYLVRSKGVSFTTLASTKPLDSYTRAWYVLRGFNVGLGAASSLTVNQGDMARYADKPSAVIWTTLFGYSIASALPCLYGILVAAAAKKLTGTAFWNVWDVMGYMLDQYPEDRGARFGIWFCATSMALAYLAVNLATNSFPFGSDLSAMFPRWMTIRRGQVLCTLLGAAIVPWKILSSAALFISFLSGYGYWLSPIAACMCIDYYIIKKGNLNVHDIFVGNSSSRYWFKGGVNYRATVVTIVALLPCLPSFAASIDKNHLGMSLTAQYFFYVSFIFTYTFAAILYYLSYLVFPEKNLAVNERSLKFEQWADDNDLMEKNVRDEESSAQDGARSPASNFEEKDVYSFDKE